MTPDPALSEHPSREPKGEYSALRATIRDRGTARVVLVPFIFIGWAATAVATAAVITVALSTLVPLIVLAAGFEAVFALHVNVERIGRYLQAFHEDGRGWEHVAMEFGRRHPQSAPNPLFARLFGLGASMNVIPAALGGEPWEVLVVLALHVLFMYRVRQASEIAAKQRVEDLRWFEEIRDARDARDARSARL